MNWQERCLHWKNKWSNEGANTTDAIDLYDFIESINRNIGPNDSIVVDAGVAVFVAGQKLKLKTTNRYICSGGQGDMGFGLPASIGVALGNIKGNTILIIGDGGFNTNIQELAVIYHLNLPIKIFVLNNNGYLSIRNTQNKFYQGHLIGCDREHGIWFPDLIDIAKAYKITFRKMIKYCDDVLFNEILNKSMAFLVEVMCSEKQQVLPAVAFKDGKQMGLSQMYPFLSDEEFNLESEFNE